MTRSRLATALFTAGASLLLLAVPANAAAQGDANSGDVWVDTAGQPSGPGHEMDPHLPCADIAIWGSGLADASGTFVIAAQAPSGSGQVYPATGTATWAYSASGQHPGPAEVVATVSITTLMSDAAAAGMTAQPQQGYHFKLDFGQDPVKHKVFWIDCTGTTGGGGGGGGGGTPTPTPAPTAVATPTPESTPTPTPTATAAPIVTATATPTATPGGSVLGITASGTPTSSTAAVGSGGAGAGAAAAGGVLGISTPATGAGILLILGLALLAAGAFALMGGFRTARRRG